MQTIPDISTTVTPASGAGETPAFDAAAVRVVVPVIAESLQIDKRTVDTGRGVRVQKRIQEDVVTVAGEPLRYDEVTVERVAVGRTVDAHPSIRHEGDTMVFPVVVERVVTHVVLELVEEIRITRRQLSRVVPQDVVLRREEVVVERFDDGDGRGPASDR